MTRVWVTRVEGEDGELATELRQCGLTPVVEPVLELHLIHSTLDEIAKLKSNDWLILTSPFAIRSLAGVASPGLRVAVIGQASSKLAQAAGLNVQLVSPTSSAAGLWDQLANQEYLGSICFPRSSLAHVPKINGLRIDAPVLYNVEPRNFDRHVVSRSEVVTFTSSSAVLSVMSRLERLELPAVSIGPSTTQALHSNGISTIFEATERTLQSVANASVIATRNCR